MSPRQVVEAVRREAPILADATPLSEAVRAVLDSGLPALPVERSDGRYAGIFGEREFIAAVFPKYLQTVGYVGFVGQSVDEFIDRRREAAEEPVRAYMNTEHVDVPLHAADVQLAETFLSHRVLILPVTDENRVRGVVLRSEFFRALAERFVAGDPGA